METIKQINCHKFNDCSAPICPLQQNTIDGGIWYPDEDICTAKKFQTLPWIKKQKAIVKAKATNDKYFTAGMLKAISRVQRGITGIDPDQPLEKAKKAEKEWILGFRKRAKLPSSEPEKGENSLAKKKEHLVSVGRNTKGGEK